MLKRKYRHLPAIVCVQQSAEKKVITDNLLIQANKLGFGDEIGAITNRVTAMFDVMARFEKDTKEHIELSKRIMLGQHYQQGAIDKIKGCEIPTMPKEYYKYKPNKIHEDDDVNTMLKKEFNQKILANKKPYFFIYNYPKLKKEYNKYIKDTNKSCIRRFGLSVNELIDKIHKTDEEKDYLEWYEYKNPVFNNPCTMNNICHYLERELDQVKLNINDDSDFDYNILRCPDIEYSKKNYKQISELYDKYKYDIKQYMIKSNEINVDKEDKQMMRNLFKDKFKNTALTIVSNEQELCNIVLDLCYKNKYSKQFAWDISANMFIKNLLKLNDGKICYFEQDIQGDIDFNGMKFIKKIKDFKLEGDEV